MYKKRGLSKKKISSEILLFSQTFILFYAVVGSLARSLPKRGKKKGWERMYKSRIQIHWHWVTAYKYMILFYIHTSCLS
ncbi:hypothetical protein BDC45DRAFT_512153 [Circinella umbellata]|nr:hypothetical protein BDC45DRAFT_512153 [Circinella umbellata]